MIDVTSTGGSLGAEIGGVDISQPLDADIVAQLKEALLRHFVIYFRGQSISEEDQVRFTTYFGRPTEHVREQPDRPVKEIFVISNVKSDGRPIGGLGNDEIPFHSDLSYMEKPGRVSMLYAVETPRTGGDTYWVNCCNAFDALDDDFKIALRGFRAVHRHPIESQNPPHPVEHPVIRYHPDNGRKSIFVSPHLTKYIVGLPPDESQVQLDRLYRHLTQPRFVWRHEWRPGDMVIWDNRFTMHRRAPFPDSQRRIMKRTQVFNEESVIGKQ
jgi:taurine dioxygenase